MIRFKKVFFPVLLGIVSCLLAGCVMDPGSSFDHALSSGVPSKAAVAGTIDGDTIRIFLPDGGTETLRILGIDTPEGTAKGNDPARFNGVADPELLAIWGREAALYTREQLDGQIVMITYDTNAGTRDTYGRLLATVTLPDGTDHGEDLIREGLARVYTQETFSRKGRYLAAQGEAMDARRGIWSGHAPLYDGARQIVITDVHYNAAGDDNENLNGEYITIGNRGTTTADLTSWEIMDSDGFVYVIPALSLPPGETMVIYTGNGTLSAGILFMESAVPVLNNDGDSVTLIDRQGNKVSSFLWGCSPEPA